jgi:hypothetical protein
MAAQNGAGGDCMAKAMSVQLGTRLPGSWPEVVLLA